MSPKDFTESLITLPRYYRQVKVRYGHPGQSYHGQGSTSNVSQFGLFVMTDTPEPLSQMVWLLVALPEREDPVQLVGRVVWVRPSELAESQDIRPGFGVELNGAPDDWIDFVRGLRRSRRLV